MYDTSSGDDCTFDYSMLFINSTAELVSIVFVFFALKYLNRSTAHWWCYIIAIVSLVIMASVSTTSTVAFGAAYLGRMAVNSIDTVNCVRTPELYTTEVRTIALSFLFFISRVAALISSYFVDDYSISTTTIAIVLAVVNAVTAISLLYIRETKGQDMDVRI